MSWDTFVSWQLWVAWVLIAANVALAAANSWLLRRNERTQAQLKALAADLETVAHELVGPPL